MRKGKLTTWKDDRGFGFIQPENGDKQVFLHISAFKNKRNRPKEGDVIKYQLTTDAKGKLAATNASIQERFSPWILVLLILAVLPIYGTVKLSIIYGNPLAIAVYPITGLITYLLYRYDKKQATNGKWRTPESTLHFWELMGGWMGGFIAQNILHHKSRKSSYQLVYWLIVSVHLVGWVYWLFFMV
jgi:uncharacterized membrane protein YsdA (DUF1294 family)/cold shock CspA family protein